MAEHMYKIVELVGTSAESWEKAAASVIVEARKHLRDLRVAEIGALDIHIGEDETLMYRAKVKLSFKYHGENP